MTAGVQTSALAERIRAVLAIDPAAPAIEFEGRWRTWAEVGATASAVAALIDRPGAQVGIVLRNRPLHVAALLGVVMGGGCVVTINPGRGQDRTRADIAGLDLDVLMGAAEDLVAVAPDGEDRPVLVAGDDVGESVDVRAAGPAHRTAEPSPGVAVRMLTSGTTGPPKRIDLGADTLERMLVGAKHYESSRADEPVLRGGVAVVSSPLVHLGGLFRILQCVCDGRSFALLERFTVHAWADVVRRHRPKTVSLVPAALRTVLESDLRREDLSSVLSVISGTAPLSPDDADAFYERFGVPVLTSYAATEFAGGVAGWNLADFKEFGATKRGSVGRAHAGCALRVVEVSSVEGESGAVLGPDEVGLLEVKAAQLGAGVGWMRTTDLATIDADGFLWIVGRADQAIIRGGFKVHPTEVARVLEVHPAVRGAVVFGIDDARLGAVPVALVERRVGHELTEDDLLAHARASLSGYEVPTTIRFVAEMPRTDSGKIDLSEARAAFEASA